MNTINYNNYSDEKIFITDLTFKIENLGKEKDKNDFIKNYAKLKEQIEKTDNIIDTDFNMSEKYNSYNIQELFEILESNSELIYNPDKLDVDTFKMLLNVSSILEEKLNTESMNIIESTHF